MHYFTERGTQKKLNILQAVFRDDLLVANDIFVAKKCTVFSVDSNTCSKVLSEIKSIHTPMLVANCPTF